MLDYAHQIPLNFAGTLTISARRTPMENLTWCTINRRDTFSRNSIIWGRRRRAESKHTLEAHARGSAAGIARHHRTH
jgi:hypothetical protein